MRAVDYTLILREEELQRGVFETANKINDLIEFVSSQIIGRQEIIRQSFYALLTGEHQLLCGRTGMAKSLLARQIFNCFDQAIVFEKQLTKDSMPDNLFGAYDIIKLKQGKMFHNVQGSIVLADFAFLDEIFDANDMLLRSLLSLMNEKKLVNGEQQVDSNINSVIAAANYLRNDRILEAVLDRFIYKSYIPEERDMYTQILIDHVYQKNKGEVVEPDFKIGLDEFRSLKMVIKTQVVPDYILFLKNYILNKYIKEVRSTDATRSDYTIGDRTRVKIQKLLCASAVLDYRTQVEEKDLNQMYYLVCMLGKNEEKERLINIIDTTSRYFRSDKEILEDTFALIRQVQDIKSSKGIKLPVSMMEEMDVTLKRKRGLRQKLQDITKKVLPFPNKPESVKIILAQYCNALKEMAAKKETIELICGLEKDLDSF